MKKLIKHIAYLLIFIPFLISCSDEGGPSAPEFGKMVVKFDNFVGNKNLQLEPVGSTNFNFTNAKGQQFNITKFGYYISHVRLEGPGIAAFVDDMKASASETKGYYRIVHGDPSTYQFTLENIPAGKYDKISFTIGVREDGITEGAVAGILDKASGAWFWNWNSGYIHFLMEGRSSASTATENGLRFHIGGWKNIPSTDPTEPQRFFDNNVTVEIPFDAPLTVGPKLMPSPHIHVDIEKFLDDTDFSTTSQVHSPAPGRAFVERIKSAFYLDHTHQ